MINNCFEEDSDKFGSEIEVFEYPYKYFSNKSDNETIGFVVPDEHLNNSGSLGIFIVHFEMSHLLNLCKKESRRKLQLYIKYIHPHWEIHISKANP